MIREGSKGSINLFYKGVLLSSFPLTQRKTEAYYLNLGDEMIIGSMRAGHKIKDQIKTYLTWCNMSHTRKVNKMRMKVKDHDLVLSCFFALIKLQILENDNENGYLVMARKKSSALIRETEE